MKEVEKKQILDKAKEHLEYIREKIISAINFGEGKSVKMIADLKKAPPSDRIVRNTLMHYNNENTENLRQLYTSSYFTRCDFEIDGQKREVYISKFSFSDEGVYSWITPIASLRFENPGTASYTRPNGKIRSGFLSRKDQFLIVDGKIVFFSTEGVQIPRELIFQEHFARHKQGFVLPEVVELMEKAQDQIVRAHHHGPFAISGPAGSGKTTLALHRVAFLIQSPETAEWFTPDKILVLVQDVGTKEYFSYLLPELGIRGVSIITFFEWASSVLDLEGYQPTDKMELAATEQKLYEYAKLKALKNLPKIEYSNNVYNFLKNVYENFLDDSQKIHLAWQKKNRTLDRFDLTVLLKSYLKTGKGLFMKKEMYYQLANDSYRKKFFSLPANYNLMIIDEFQNYLPEQLAILKSCINKRLNSVIYVGDLAQQTRLGTIRSWSDIEEKINPERLVVLQKVYRNTKQILNYIKSLGYTVSIPSEIKEGELVAELKMEDKTEEIEYVKNLLVDQTDISIGVLAFDKNYLNEFKACFGKDNRVYCLSMQEAQGVEFDIVCLVGIQKNLFNYNDLPTEIIGEVNKINRDLLYIALTRAMSELHILGNTKLSAVLGRLV